MKPAAVYFRILLRRLWWLTAVLVVLLAVTISVLRYTLPYLDSQKQQIANWISQHYDTDVKIGRIEGGWQGVGPVLNIKDIRLINKDNGPVSLHIDTTQIDVDFWASIRSGQLVSKRFNLIGLDMTVDADRIATGSNDYPIVSALKNLFLQQLQRFSVVNSQISIHKHAKSQVVSIQRLGWINQGDRHQGVGQMQVADLTSNSASFVLDLYGDADELNGTFYADARELDLSPWIAQVMPTKIAVTDNQMNFQFWADIQHSKVVDVLANLANSRLAWQDKTNSFVQINSGYIHAKPANGGWIADLHDLNYSTQQHDHNVINGVLQADSQRNIVVSFEPLDISPLLPLMAVAGGQQLADNLNQLNPQGQLDKADLKFTSDGLQAALQIDHLKINQWQDFPGLDDAQLSFMWKNQRGTLSFHAQQGTLHTAGLLKQDLNFQALSARLEITHENDNWQLSAPRIDIVSDSINGGLSFDYQSQSGQLAVVADIRPMPISVVKTLLPEQLMGTNTYQYLLQALVDGTMSGAKILWQGVPSDFPFSQHQGVFQAQVDMQQATFNFDNDWPNLQDLQLQLLFENDGLTMRSSQGHLKSVAMQNLTANIPTLTSNAILSIDINSNADGAQVSELMSQTPLADSVGASLKQINISGPLNSHIHLHIPLGEGEVVASGEVGLKGNPVFFTSLDEGFDQLDGTLSFRNDHIQAKGLTARLMGQTMQLSLDGGEQQQGYVTKVSLSGHWPLKPLLQRYYPGLGEYLNGTADWLGNLQLTIPASGFTYQFALSSDLPRVSSTLPVPFAKQLNNKQHLSVQLDGNQQATNASLQLGEQIRFDGVLPHKEKHFSRAHLSIGKEPLLAMGTGFSISANVDQLNLDHWFAALQTLFKQGPSLSGPSALGAPERIFVNATELQALNQTFHNVSATVRLLPEQWRVDMGADEFKAKLDIDHDWLGKGMRIDADYINLDEWKTASNGPEFNIDMSRFPPLQFNCKECRYKQYQLGKIELQLSRANNGMHIDKFRIDKSGSKVDASGDWYADNGATHTRLKGTFDSKDLGNLLKDFDLNSGIRDSDADIRFDLNWLGAPQQFNYASLNGQVKWHLGEGYLAEVSDKGARIFSILSLDSLVRKLKLDFRDVFTKGFFYDKMTGTFQVNNGRVNTDDADIDGAAGDMQLRGYTDLASKVLNYKIAFTPKITSSLPVIVAWMVNPATALAALALDEVITSAKVVSSINFSLTGTLDQPKLIELGRDSKEIQLPARQPVTSPTKTGQPKAIPKHQDNGKGEGV